ncbi:MAG: alpha/beta hydrolase family protein [Deltaproteobacteria bacterium]|nr:alpha/beta hydrolase family protein [Deltaproteobacteria bacterium]MBW2537631.1 alpha/beta hydrolase family protein [Deltaproteobacteria bacterium]
MPEGLNVVAEPLGAAAHRLLSSAAARWTAGSVDRAFVAFLRAQTARARRRERGSSESFERRLERLQQQAARIEARLATAGVELFPSARKIAPRRHHERFLEPRCAVQDVAWPSDYQPLLPELHERYRRHPQNLRGAAQLWLHRSPRPMAILIHGYMGGDYAVEARVWPLRWLFRAGLDLALFVLPLHGARAISGRRGPPPFPSRDPRMSNEGLCHAIGDLRDLVGWLRRRGHPAVGVMGMSLGAYTAALAATFIPKLDFVVPIVPLASLADFAREQGRLDPDPRREALEMAALERVHRAVSPLERTSILERGRMLIVAGDSDRITPASHADRLALRFDAPVTRWPGGHLLQLGRMACFREVLRLLTDQAILPAPPEAPS